MYRAASRDCDHDHQAVERPDVTPNDLGNRRDAGPIGGVSELTDEFDHTTNGDG